jgi:hypothetical protein
VSALSFIRRSVFRAQNPTASSTGTPPGHRYWNRRRLREAKTMADRVRLHAEREEQERRMG